MLHPRQGLKELYRTHCNPSRQETSKWLDLDGTAYGTCECCREADPSRYPPKSTQIINTLCPLFPLTSSNIIIQYVMNSSFILTGGYCCWCETSVKIWYVKRDFSHQDPSREGVPRLCGTTASRLAATEPDQVEGFLISRIIIILQIVSTTITSQSLANWRTSWCRPQAGWIQACLSVSCHELNGKKTMMRNMFAAKRSASQQL